jgi:hypothetical protein
MYHAERKVGSHTKFEVPPNDWASSDRKDFRAVPTDRWAKTFFIMFTNQFENLLAQAPLGTELLDYSQAFDVQP